MKTRVRNLGLSVSSVRWPLMLMRTSAASATAMSWFELKPMARSSSSAISAAVPPNPKRSVVRVKYAALRDRSRSQGLPDASTHVPVAICSMKYTSCPSFLNPSAQLSRVHAAPPFMGLFASAPETTISAMGASTQVQLPRQGSEDLRGLEALLRQTARRAGVSHVIAIDRVRRLGGLFNCRKGQQASAAWQPIADARVLREHRPAAGEIADAAVAEPAAAGLQVHAFRDHEFGRRTADVVAVPPGVARNHSRLHQ